MVLIFAYMKEKVCVCVTEGQLGIAVCIGLHVSCVCDVQNLRVYGKV